MSLDSARSADRAREYVSAAALYEEVVTTEPTLRVMLDLALLYWRSIDPGISARFHLSGPFIETADRRAFELLDEAQRRFPSSTEARFWSRYIHWTDRGVEFEPEECRRLLKEDPAVLVPALYLFSVSAGTGAAERRMHCWSRRAQTGPRVPDTSHRSSTRPSNEPGGKSDAPVP